ncbi:uncharacterized protein LOC108677397 isoform X2 [Hyalella azteca]|uniref:Uncharacterized protein LOC108677397 isoform X2 n=1 Tax=Hyalella azteca TaxID=294128 RepID=A0A8B7P582_HYAAZ|nr:uncharacterized protein LOC108677397 isoform X2 [Hyalella azteca]
MDRETGNQSSSSHRRTQKLKSAVESFIPKTASNEDKIVGGTTRQLSWPLMRKNTRFGNERLPETPIRDPRMLKKKTPVGQRSTTNSSSQTDDGTNCVNTRDEAKISDLECNFQQSLLEFRENTRRIDEKVDKISQDFDKMCDRVSQIQSDMSEVLRLLRTGKDLPSEGNSSRTPMNREGFKQNTNHLNNSHNEIPKIELPLENIKSDTQVTIDNKIKDLNIEEDRVQDCLVGAKVFPSVKCTTCFRFAAECSCRHLSAPLTEASREKGSKISKITNEKTEVTSPSDPILNIFSSLELNSQNDRISVDDTISPPSKDGPTLSTNNANRLRLTHPYVAQEERVLNQSSLGSISSVAAELPSNGHIPDQAITKNVLNQSITNVPSFQIDSQASPKHHLSSTVQWTKLGSSCVDDSASGGKSEKSVTEKPATVPSDDLSCSSEILPMSLLPPEEVHRYRNAVLIQKLIPESLQTLLSWLSEDKVESKSYFWYIKYKTRLSEKELKEKYYFTSSEIKLLKEDDASAFDVTLLIKLIKMFAGIADCPHENPCDHDDTKAECLLWKLRNHRNLISHKIKTSSTSEHVFTTAKDTMIKLFSVLDLEKVKIGKEAVDQHIQKIQQSFKNVGNTDYERQCMEQQFVFKTEALKESQSYWRQYGTSEAVPFTGNVVNSGKVYHPMELFVKEKLLSDGGVTEKISYRHILKRTNEDGRKATVLVGEAGSGKTTVVKNIVLQFLGIIPVEVEFLKEIHLLLFLECRDRTTTSLENAVKNNFPQAFRKISLSLNSFCSLGNIVIIDGYDEVNESSSNVINQILRQMKSMISCHILLTTRPHRADQLKNLLNSSGIQFTTFELVPLSEEEDQLEFLQRYEENSSPEAPSSLGMTLSFKSLLPEVKQFFVYPINLVLFYFLYTYSPETIESWETSNDVIEQMLILYEKFIAKKLLERHFVNLECFIQEALGEIYQFAFDCISADKVMLSAEDMRPVQRCLETKFREWKLLNKLDVSVVTSVVFLTKTVPNPACPVVYQFYHKSIQEIMAARTFVRLMKKEVHVKLVDLLAFPGPTKEKNRENPIDRYNNVLLFVLSHLAQPSNCDTLAARSEELERLLEQKGVDMSFFSEVVLTKPKNEILIKMGVSLVKKFKPSMISCKREYQAMRAIMDYYHPKLLAIRHNDEQLPPPLTDLLHLATNTFLGQLELIMVFSYWRFQPLDSLVKEILPSRFTLGHFSGCLATVEGMQALSTLLNLCGEPPVVAISVPDPYHNGLHLLPMLKSTSSIRFPYKDFPDGVVPRGTPMKEPTVHVADTGKAKDLFNLLMLVAPKNKRFRRIILERCTCSVGFLEKVTRSLKEEGVVTTLAFKTEVQKMSFMYGWCEGCSHREHAPMETCMELLIK